MKIVWLDSWYPAAFEAAKTNDYEKLNIFSHGTSDYWDIALRAAGHESVTLIGNVESGIIEKAISLQPDVICSQNVGLWYPALLKAMGFKGKCVGFCSYAAERMNLHGWDVVFSSFRWLVDALNRDGQKAVHLPLAFGRAVLDRFPQPAVRDLPVTFVGGLGTKIWAKGTADMAAVAKALPDKFHWYGYRVGKPCPELLACYRGEAWGPAYWNVLMRSQITINRHGEIAKGEQRQNMREYEASGCATWLVSDVTKSWNGGSWYENSDQLIDQLCVLLDRLDTVQRQALEAQELILRQDCYEHRVPAFIEAIQSC